MDKIESILKDKKDNIDIIFSNILQKDFDNINQASDIIHLWGKKDYQMSFLFVFDEAHSLLKNDTLKSLTAEGTMEVVVLF